MFERVSAAKDSECFVRVSLSTSDEKSPTPSRKSDYKEVSGGKPSALGVSDSVHPSVCCSSEDDPFLLYATLNSGNHCKFITKDLMRDHKACLSDVRTQHLFFRWQQGHQMAIMNDFQRSKLTFQVRDLLSK